MDHIRDSPKLDDLARGLGGTAVRAPHDAGGDAARIYAGLRPSDGADPFVAAVRATRMPMTITDPRQADNPIVFANDAFCALTLYQREEVLGRNCRFLQGPETEPDAVRRIHQAVAGSEPIEVDIRNYRRDGSWFWNRLLVAPVHDKDGNVAYFFASQFDVTAEREGLLERSRELARTVEQLRDEAATREQVEEALRHAQKLETVGQLTGGIAHDFNNMLQAIDSSLELMRRRLQQGRLAELPRFIEGARKTVERGAALTNRLLAFARRQTLQPRPVVLDTLIEGMGELIRRTVGPSVEVELRMRDGDWAVLCDPNQLEGALLNAALNARDAMPDGGRLVIGTREVTLDAADVADQEGAMAGDYIETSIRDTGTGMTEVTRSRVFEPFFTTKPLGQGTGLGLSQLYGFVRQSRGAVRVESGLGQGTTIRLFLPRSRAAEEINERSGAAAAAVMETVKATLLLVEDEPIVRDLVAERLRELGYAVHEAPDGSAALQILRAEPRLDLLVTDVGLGGSLNGRQLADAARELRPLLPVLFMTGFAGTALEAQLEPGMGVIGKPFGLEALAERVQGMLEG